jgi:tRNA (uracil-5-)-methyltransferase TRM9
VADILSLPHAAGSFDFAISIAVIHHLSSRERRILAVAEILKLLKPTCGQNGPGPAGGQALIFVWALEQKDSRRGWGQGDKQDVLVPWVLKQEHTAKPATTTGVPAKLKDALPGSTQPLTYQRYYHLYREGELQQDVIAAGGRVVREGYDRDNWWAVVARTD